ncbi:hypothetical protein CsSME_00010273 [Camellia sinensis var. sinensis]
MSQPSGDCGVGYLNHFLPFSDPSLFAAPYFSNVKSYLFIYLDTAKSTSAKDKSTYILVPKQDDRQLSDKSVAIAAASGAEVSEEESACICMCVRT